MIGIIAAESKEMNEIKKLMKNIEEKDSIYNFSQVKLKKRNAYLLNVEKEK